MDDDKELSLRDKFAIAALQAMLNRFDGDDAFMIFVRSDNGAGKAYMEAQERKMERLTIVAYKIADHMRKTRLAAFK